MLFRSIITIDAQGIVTDLNPAAARVFGYRPEEVIGRNVEMLMPEPYCGEHDGYLSAYLETGQAKMIGCGREVTGQRKDGSLFPMELAVSEIVLSRRRMFTGVVRDITERKQIEAERQRVERHQKQLVAELTTGSRTSSLRLQWSRCQRAKAATLQTTFFDR